MVLEQTVIGIVAGIAFGLVGYFGNRELDPEEGWEGFNYAKIGRTVVVYGAAGAIVGYAGDPITQGNIATATGSTVILGELAERVIKGALRHYNARQ